MGENVIGYKVTDKNGHPFYIKDEKYKLEIGKTIEEKDFDPKEKLKKGIFLCPTVATVLANGIDAANLDPRYKARGTWANIPKLVKDGIKIFKVEALDPVYITSDIIKTPKITVLEEVPVEQYWEEVVNSGVKLSINELLHTGMGLALAFLGATVPGPIVKALEKTHNLFVQKPLLLNPNNPNRIKVGDKVKFEVLGIEEGMLPPEKKLIEFFIKYNKESNLTVTAIDSDVWIVSLKGETGETISSEITWLCKVL